MDTASRWLCSFVADKVRFRQMRQTVTCGKNVLLCTIELTNVKSKFTNYHENKFTVSYLDNKVAAVRDCLFDVNEGNSKQLNVYCKAHRAGKATVRLDLGKWYLFEGNDTVNINILPSSPKCFKNVGVCCIEKSMDPQHRPEGTNTLYYGIKSLLKFEVVDQFGNKIYQLKDNQYDIYIEYNNVSYQLEWEMRSGIIFAVFLPKSTGKKQMAVWLADINESTCTYQMSINILRPPCSPLLTLQIFDNPEQCCTAGEEVNFKVKLYDIFGNQILQNVEESCVIDVQTPSPRRRVGKERANVKTHETDFSITVCLETSGLRNVKLSLSSGSMSSYKDVYVKVLPATPHQLSEISFATNNAIDESFSPNPKVIYRNQWSTLDARLVDFYDNIVRELKNDYDVTLELYDDYKEKIEMKYKDSKIQDGTFQVAVKISKVGKHDLFITLKSKNNPDQIYRLKKIQVQIVDAPLYLAGSKFHHPNSCKAGEEFKIEIIPFDVFGCPLPATSIAGCNLAGLIFEGCGKREIINLSLIIKNDSKFVICFSIVLVKAGRRDVRILDKNRNVTQLSTHLRDIQVDINPSSPKCMRNAIVSCVQKPTDKDHRIDDTSILYCGKESLVKLEIIDEYGNLIHQLGNETCYHVKIEESDNILYPLEWEMVGCQIFATFFPKLVGKKKITIHLVEKRLDPPSNESICFHQMRINTLRPPCSPSLTLKFFDDNLKLRGTAGKEVTLEIKLFDVFGDPVLQYSKETCNIVIQAPVAKTKQKERVLIKKIVTPKCLQFAVTICFKTAGLREATVVVNSGQKSSFKNIYVDVHPATPHHLTNASFTANTPIDESFSPDPEVIYRNQWSTLDGKLVDYYDNNVRKFTNDYDVTLEIRNDKGKKIEMKYEDSKIQHETFQIAVKISEAGKHNLSITLKSKNNPDQMYHLTKIQIEVIDAPLYLAGSECHYPDSSVAGKEIEIEIIPSDVFGFPLPATSTTDYNLIGDILERKENEESMNIKVIKKSNVTFFITAVFTKTGRRSLRIYDKDKNRRAFFFDVNPDLSDVHWQVTAPKRTVYKREKLTLTVNLLDCFNNEVRIDGAENILELTRKSGPDGLDCTRKFMENNHVTIEYYLNRTGIYDLCLVDSDGNIREGTSFRITVSDAPLDCHHSTIYWIPQYDNLEDQPVFPEDESFRCCLKLKDAVGCDYEKKIKADCIEVKYGNTKVKGIKVSSSANAIGTYIIVVPLKNLTRDDPDPEFFCFVNGMKIESPLTLPTFEGFEKHDDDGNCVVEHRAYEIVKLVCHGVKKNEIVGSDFSHLNNIKRVCYMYDDPSLVESISNDFEDYDDDEPLGTERSEDDDTDGDDYDYSDHDHDHDYDDEDYDDHQICTNIELPFEEIVCETDLIDGDWIIIICTLEEIENKINEFRNILLHLLRATYYRKEAFELDKARESWKDRASENYRRVKEGESIAKDFPHFCSQIKEKYAKLMRRYHDAACDEFFQFFNAKRDQSEIDLHGLLVVDEKKLQDYERQLRLKGRLNPSEVNKKIKEEREHGNEAIRKLHERLDDYDLEKAREEGEPWLEIIVGSGHHSKVRQQIRPKVEKYLKKREMEYSPVNKGALVVTFEPYKGSEPCFGEYYCTECDNRWRNGRSWIRKWQACYNCYKREGSFVKCYPLKQRAREKDHFYAPRVVSIQRRIPAHVKELCEMCIELRKECSRRR